jgi:hypothetical protein
MNVLSKEYLSVKIEFWHQMQSRFLMTAFALNEWEEWLEGTFADTIMMTDLWTRKVVSAAA